MIQILLTTANAGLILGLINLCLGNSAKVYLKFEYTIHSDMVSRM